MSGSAIIAQGRSHRLDAGVEARLDFRVLCRTVRAHTISVRPGESGSVGHGHTLARHPGEPVERITWWCESGSTYQLDIQFGRKWDIHLTQVAPTCSMCGRGWAL